MKSNYRRARIWRRCVCGRGCPWCAGNRQHGNQQRENAAAYIEKEARDEISDRINERDNKYILKV